MGTKPRKSSRLPYCAGCFFSFSNVRHEETPSSTFSLLRLCGQPKKKTVCLMTSGKLPAKQSVLHFLFDYFGGMTRSRCLHRGRIQAVNNKISSARLRKRKKKRIGCPHRCNTNFYETFAVCSTLLKATTTAKTIVRFSRLFFLSLSLFFF